MRDTLRSAGRPGFVLLLLVSLAGCAAPGDPASDGAGVVAIEQVTVIPMDRDGVLEGRTVLIRDGRIVAVDPADSTSIPDGAQVIDGRGKYLLPSLVDTHVHLSDPGDLLVFLAHGVGAVRNLEGSPYHLFLRDEVAAGKLPGARLFTCGPYTNAPRIESPAAAQADVAQQKQAGYDCVKIHGDLAPDTLVALGQSSRAAGLPLIGHVPRNLELLDVLDSGAMQEISHAEEFLYTHFAHRPKEDWDAAIDEAVEATRRAGIDVTPTLSTYRSIWRQVADLDSELARLPLQLAGPFARRSFRPSNNRYRRKFKSTDAQWLEEYFTVQKKLVLRLHAAGVPLLTGTDANSPVNVPGFALHEELALLVEIGLSPYDALRAATLHGWQRVTGRDDVGSVAPGMQAELLLLDADPLADIGHVKRVAGVFARGAWHPASKLSGDVDALTALYAGEQPFVDLLWDNTIDDAVTFYRERKAAEPTGFVFRAETLVCQSARAIREGVPEVAAQALEVALEEYPDHPLVLAWRKKL